jgi:Excalibur calcium-binding domain
VKKLIAAALLALSLAACSAGTTDGAGSTDTTEEPTTTTPTASKCDATLWKHVYHPARLQVVDRCITVTGKVSAVKYEPDGDAHIRLTVDPAYHSLLKPANTTGQHGDMVLEPICLKTVTQADAKAACAGFHSSVKIPPVGARVQVTGSYVLDLQHDGWAEIHPVTSFSVISAPPKVPPTTRSVSTTRSVPPTTAAGASVYYANCAAARAAGAAPIHRGEPGYRSGLDRDGDGIACE